MGTYSVMSAAPIPAATPRASRYRVFSHQTFSHVDSADWSRHIGPMASVDHHLRKISGENCVVFFPFGCVTKHNSQIFI